MTTDEHTYHLRVAGRVQPADINAAAPLELAIRPRGAATDVIVHTDQS
ncbi:MAG: hypothetical protein ACFB51_12185 [Anaerolineae bacterium]